MGTVTKTVLIIATALILLGFVVFAIALALTDGDFTKLGIAKYVTNTHEINEDFNSISINSDTADIVFLPAEDGKCKVVCYEIENLQSAVCVDNDTLKLTVEDTRKWYERISLMGSSKTTIYLPKEQYLALTVEQSTGDVEISKGFLFESIDISVSTGDVKCYALAQSTLKIKTSTGDALLQGVSATSVDISVGTGSVNMSDISCVEGTTINVSTGKAQITNAQLGSLSTSGTTGDIDLNNVIVNGKMYIKRNTGDVKLDSCDAKEIEIETSTGDVDVTLLTIKQFSVTTSTGKVKIPQESYGDKCKITTSTGDITVAIK